MNLGNGTSRTVVFQRRIVASDIQNKETTQVLTLRLTVGSLAFIHSLSGTYENMSLFLREDRKMVVCMGSTTNCFIYTYVSFLSTCATIKLLLRKSSLCKFSEFEHIASFLGY